MFTERESIFDLEFDSPWVKYLFFAFVFGLSLFFVIYDFQKQLNYDYKGEFYKEHVNDEFHGIVHRKWFYHHTIYIKLMDSTEIIGYYSIYKKVNKGDSLIKEKNSRTIRIVKKDTIIYNDIYDENRFRFELR